jgi:hypothetical protein
MVDRMRSLVLGDAYLSALPLAVAYRTDGVTLDLVAADGTTVATYVRATSP